jgi:hypothetical protein
MHLFLHFFGLDSASGTAYLAWSGILSDIGEIAIIGGLIGLYRKHACVVHRCWRIGRHGTAAGHNVCRRHHPDGAPTHSDVIKAHAVLEQARMTTPPEAR